MVSLCNEKFKNEADLKKHLKACSTFKNLKNSVKRNKASDNHSKNVYASIKDHSQSRVQGEQKVLVSKESKKIRSLRRKIKNIREKSRDAENVGIGGDPFKPKIHVVCKTNKINSTQNSQAHRKPNQREKSTKSTIAIEKFIAPNDDTRNRILIIVGTVFVATNFFLLFRKKKSS